MNPLQYVKNPNLLVEVISSALEVVKEDIQTGYIFGSVSKGNFLIDSDVDIFIISDKDIYKQIRHILDETLVDQGIGYDLIFMTCKEFESQKDLPILKEVVGGLKLWETEKTE